MERRRSRRRTVSLKAERISCTGNCSVFIENISETGIYMMTAPVTDNIYKPGNDIGLELELASGEIISLDCNVKWAYDNETDALTNKVGLEIIEPPEEYKNFIKSLH